MPTVPIVPQATAPAPFAVTQSKPIEAALLAAYAEWDGSGASGSFLPCLEIYSDAGVRLMRVFPSQAVAAGDSAVVSYLPLGLAGSAGAGGGISLIKNNDGSITVAGGSGPTTTLTLDEPWAMASGALAAVADNSGGEPYATGFPAAPLQVLSRLKANSAIFTLSGGNLFTKADGVYIVHVCLSPGPLTGLTLPLASPPPRLGISVSTGLGSDPEPPFGQVSVYTSDLLGSITFSTIASVSGASSGSPAGIVFLGLEAVGNLAIGWWLGVIAHRPHSVPHSLYP